MNTHMAAWENKQMQQVNNQLPAFLVADEVKDFCRAMKSLCTETELPRVKDFDLMAVHKLAPRIMVLDIEKVMGRLKIRFLGTRLVRIFRRETTGMYLDEVDIGPYPAQQLVAFNKAATRKMPQWININVTLSVDLQALVQEQRHLAYERVIYPLQDDQGDVVQLASIFKRHACEETQDKFEHREIQFDDRCDHDVRERYKA